MKIIFIRHGQGYHNIIKDNKTQYHILYPQLTKEGILECKTTYHNLKHFHFDLVITSPLVRALQTFNLCFNHNYRKAISIDLFREIVENKCDFRKHIRTIQKDYNYIRFEGFDLNELNYNKIETKKDIEKRLYKIIYFLEHLKSLGYKHVAIVTHGALLNQLFKKYENVLHVKDTSFFKNAEWRQCEI